MSYFKTAEEHKEFLFQMTSLMLWFVAKWKYENPKESVEDIIRNRTLLRNYTDFNKFDLNADLATIPETSDWSNFIAEIGHLYNVLKVKRNYELYESEAIKIVEPYINERIDRDLSLFNITYLSAESREGSSFFFDASDADNSLESEYLSANFGNGGRYMKSHQWNNRYPESYLNEPAVFRKNLVKLIDDIAETGCMGMYGTGWMNLFPLFSRQFPVEWRKSAIGPSYDIKGNLGCWGQFISSDYSFQYKMGDRYRHAHIIPYPTTLCFAKLEDFRNFFKMRPI
ncbi:MAG: hypothetical protein V4660_06435 [Pseudomonadota bacterium]